jgi:hypothetical protein
LGCAARGGVPQTAEEAASCQRKGRRPKVNRAALGPRHRRARGVGAWRSTPLPARMPPNQFCSLPDNPAPDGDSQLAVPLVALPVVPAVPIAREIFESSVFPRSHGLRFT